MNPRGWSKMSYGAGMVYEITRGAYKGARATLAAIDFETGWHEFIIGGTHMTFSPNEVSFVGYLPTGDGAANSASQDSRTVTNAL